MMLPPLMSPFLIPFLIVAAIQAPARDTSFQYPLHLLDLGVAMSSRNGVTLAASPSVLSKEGSDSTAGVFLTFRPDSVLTWLNHAAAVLRQPLVSGAGEQIQWTRELRSARGGGHFALGRSIKQGKLKDDRWLALAEGPHGWSLKLSGKEADSLLSLLFVAASQAGFLETPDRPFSADSVEVPVRIIHQPTPEFRGEYGRVWVQFVVDTTGRADPTTFVAMLASSPTLAEQARRIILASRFKPALRHGEPVRQLVQQVLGWRFR